MSSTRIPMFSALLVGLAACGSSAPLPAADANPSVADADPLAPDANPLAPDAPTFVGRYFPRNLGATWTYKLTDTTTNTVQTGQTKVEAYVDVGGAHAGTYAFRVHIDKIGGSTVAYEDYVGDVAVRYAQTDYDTTNAVVDTQSEAPYRFKIDETPAHLLANATYAETFTETTTAAGATMSQPKTENWQVVSTAESVTVPAGTYTALHLRRTNSGGTTAKTKDYWFVKDVGKVKETGGGQSEELMSFTP